MTATINFDFEPHRNAQWTVAALIGERVVAAEQFDVTDASEITKEQVWAAKNRLAQHPDVVAAEKAVDDALPEDPAARMEAIMEMDDLEEIRVVFGMVSGGQLTYDMHKGDLRRAGAGHLAR